MSGATRRRTWRSYLWDTYDKPPEEREFLHRLDACLLSYAFLSYLSKYLDQQNITNAYVSGMKEDLGLHGNQLNYITMAWTIGYVIGQIPSNMLLTRIRPSIWIPTMELIWSTGTMFLATSNSYHSLLFIRFFVGLAEATFYPAIQYVIGSWYKPEELAKRACLFHTASSFGPIFSGILQTGAYNGLNGVFGLAGWRWLFVVDGIVTIPIAILGFYIMPDVPSTTRPSTFFSEAHIKTARRRMEDIGRKPPAKFSKAKILGFFRTWQLYLLTILYVLFNNGNGPASSMIFWLKSFNTPENTVYTIGQINTYPMGIQVVSILTTIFYAYWSDNMRKRWPPILLAGTVNIVVCTVLASTPLYSHTTRRWIFYYLTGSQSGLSGLILAWANELNGHDNEKRSFVIASCNTFAYLFQIWLPLVLFPQVEQPRVFKGIVVTAFISVGMICACLATLHLSVRDERRKREDIREDESESEVGKLLLARSSEEELIERLEGSSNLY